MEILLQKTKELIEKLGCAVDDITLVTDGPHPIIQIRSSDSKNLIGYHGETLQAINTVVRKMADREGVEEKFVIDINNYHGKRIDELKNQAKILAERARVFQHEVEMSPMNAYERMIVHATLAEEGDIVTESSGEGKFRRVVIKYKSANN